MAQEATSEAVQVETTAPVAETQAVEVQESHPAQETQEASATPAAEDDGGLAAAVAEHKAMLDGAVKAIEEKSEGEGAQQDEAKTDEQASDAKDENKSEEAKKEETKQAEPAKEEDTIAKKMAQYIKSQERAKAAEKEYKSKAAQIEADRKALESRAAEVEKTAAVVRELASLVETSPIDAIERLLGTDALTAEDSSLVSDLLERIQARRAGAPVRSQEQLIADAVRRGVQTELEAKQAAERARQEQEQKQRTAENQRHKEAFFAGLVEQYRTDHAKYPYLEALDEGDEDAIDLPKVDAFMQGYFNSNRRLPTPDEIFGHFNSLVEKKALSRVEILEKTGKLPKREQVQAQATQQPAKKPLTTTAPKATVDSRGRPAAPARTMTYEEKVEAMARRLNAQTD